MIALDTNVLVRLLVNDDPRQSRQARSSVTHAEQIGLPVMVLTEVVLETTWILESVYGCTREEIVHFLETLLDVTTFDVESPDVIRVAARAYRRGGDFADHLIVGQAKRLGATRLVSFDRQLHNIYPQFVGERF